MFYNHFIATLYHFLGLTYWHSAQCQLLFFACFFGPEDTRWAKEVPEGRSEGSTTHQGTPGGPDAPRLVVLTSVASRTASLLYKYPNIPETLGESTKINSSRRKFQKPQIQSKHHHRGVHHPHWCLSDDAWVVLCRPSGPQSVARWLPLSLFDSQYNDLLEIYLM